MQVCYLWVNRYTSSLVCVAMQYKKNSVQLFHHYVVTCSYFIPWQVCKRNCWQIFSRLNTSNAADLMCKRLFISTKPVHRIYHALFTHVDMSLTCSEMNNRFFTYVTLKIHVKVRKSNFIINSPNSNQCSILVYICFMCLILYCSLVLIPICNIVNNIRSA